MLIFFHGNLINKEGHVPELIKKYLCVICGNREIIESMTKHMFEGDVPDVSNCDFSTYSEHKISGGKLLANRPALNWTRLYFSKLENEPLSKVPGGICGKCLITNWAICNLSESGNINFVDEKNLKNSK